MCLPKYLLFQTSWHRVTPFWLRRCKQRVSYNFWESFCFSDERGQMQLEPIFLPKEMSHLQLWQSSCDPEVMSMGTKSSSPKNCLVATSTLVKCLLPDFLCGKTHRPFFCLSHYYLWDFLLFVAEQIIKRGNQQLQQISDGIKKIKVYVKPLI